MMDSCRAETPLILENLDLALSASVLGWVVHRLEQEAISAVVHLPSAEGWVSSPTCAAELRALVERASEGWIVQRPGCAGLVTRLVLLGADGSLAAIVAARGPGLAEPVGWRVILLMALLAGDRALAPEST